MPRLSLFAACLLIPSAFVLAQTTPPNALAPYIRVNDPVILLQHVRVIDGTGNAPQSDQAILIDHGEIKAVGPSASIHAPTGAKVIDLTGHTVIPGLVGMHEHLFYTEPDSKSLHAFFAGQLMETAPPLYLAAGVTSGRTTGSLETYTDLNMKHSIDTGKMPGPALDITGPYLEGAGGFSMQMHVLSDPKDATDTVDYWAGEGVTSFKAYMDITPDELKASIDAAHAHSLKITGHLCSIGFTEAADMGIDNLEHGIAVDTEFYLGKKHGVCPGQRPPEQEMADKLDIDGAPVQAMIHDLVQHHVAVTSTLAIFESFAPNRPPMAFQMRERDSMFPEAWAGVMANRAQIAEHADKSIWPVLLKKEMQFEREFVAAGGLLMAGCDPTGYGAVLPGFGDQRNLELLVEAGFTPVQAIQIATLNGAKYLGRDTQIGSIAAEKQADLVVLRADPSQDIHNIESVEMVFKDGVGYDSQALIDSTRGMVGIR